jgi:predicted RNA-binding protein with TRAM domain
MGAPMKMSTRVLQSILACGAMAFSISGCNDSNSTPPSSATIGGTVTGLSASVTLVNNGRDSQVVSADGTFTFPTRQGESSPYAVAVLTQPAGQTCTVTNGSGTVGTANVADVSVGCVANTFTVGGTISGLSGMVVLQRVGGEALSISNNGDFAFPTPIAEGNTYAVSVKTQPAGGTCTVAQGSGVVGSSSVTSITVTCAANAFTTGGTISGLIGTVVLQNNGTGTQSISADGAFTFATAVTQGKPYAVTVLTQPMDQTCSVGSGSGTMGGTKVTNVAVVCSTNTFSIGGTVSGLIGSLVLQDNGGDALTLSSSGTFTFATPVAQGSTYAVTVQTQPATQTCTVSSGTGTLGAANVSSAAVTCATNAYTVGGTVSGLSGAVTLLDNGGNILPLSTDGSFTFPSPVAEGSTYNVTVQTQPAVQICTVTNGAGTMGNSDTTNVTVTCTTNNTTLTVSATAIIPVNSSNGTLTVTNTGSYTAINVAAMLPGGWTAVTQDATDCAAIIPNGGTCTLSFTSTAPYVAQGGIVITGDNITAPPAIALAFTLNGYLVFSVDSLTSASVIDTADLTIDPWGSDTMATGAQSLTDGLSNTSAINSASGIGASAAIDCGQSTNGGAAPGTWYLPAICQMGPAGQGASCPTGLGNMDTLMQLGFAALSQFSWSSTEYSTSGAWVELFYPAGNSYQASTDKSFVFSARCARSITY